MWLTGAPGAGKGTMADVIKRERDIVHQFEVSSLLKTPEFARRKAQGLLIGGCGTVCGLGLGFVLLWLRNDIVLGLARLFGHQDVMRQFYMVTQLPSHTSGLDVAKIVIFTLVISTLAGLLPAWRAARLKPVEALRHE